MTQAERDVIDAALAAVHTRAERNVVVADIVHDVDKLRALTRAVVALNRERAGFDYWER